MPRWKGFKPIPYSLDAKALDLPLTLVQAGASTPTTLGQIYSDLKDDRRVEVDDRVLDLAIATDSGTLVVTGSGFARQVLELLLTFRQEGISGFEAAWFWYDSDSCVNDPQEMHDFFVVYKEKIVRDQVSLSESPGHGFDPSIFSGDDDSEPTWFHEKARRAAWIRFWYRRFYAETRAGQLMALRPDRPKLYYCGGLYRPEAVPNLVHKIYVLLCILVILAVASFYLRWIR